MQVSMIILLVIELLLDSEASKYLTDANQLTSITLFCGTNQITMENDQTIPISNEGHGIKPTPITLVLFISRISCTSIIL